MTSIALPLQDMHLRHWGLTQAVAANNAEAAAVCLSRHHSPPAMFLVENRAIANKALVEWVPPDPRTLGAWNNRIDATEMGACACAIAAAELARGLLAVRRADNGTGADYYLALPNVGIEDLEGCYRLEVSGTDADAEREVRRRVQEKIEQARRGNSNLPAVAGVVGFAVSLIVLADVEEVVCELE